jgi:hypothetical protein
MILSRNRPVVYYLQEYPGLPSAFFRRRPQGCLTTASRCRFSRQEHPDRGPWHQANGSAYSQPRAPARPFRGNVGCWSHGRCTTTTAERDLPAIPAHPPRCCRVGLRAGALGTSAWSRKPNSKLRPRPWKDGALPTEPFPRMACRRRDPFGTLRKYLGGVCHACLECRLQRGSLQLVQAR